MSNNRVTIKGTSDGLVITVGAGAWPSLVEELDQHLGEKASFFKGGRVALRVGPRQLTRPQLETVGQILNRHNVTLWAVEGDSPGTREAATQLGLEINLSSEPVKRSARVAAPSPPAGNSIVVQRTLRSGQVMYHPGHVIIIGDVNPGAEIRAGGNVIVWGRLRGAVHAGTGEVGDKALVCALQLAPTQLRIGNYLAHAPADEDDSEVLPEVASVQDGQIIAEPWRG